MTLSIIKSFSVGNGDTFMIKHNSDNFTIIDCCLSEENRESIVDELIKHSRDKGIHRFISTHPDEDHILGLTYLEERMGVSNFYCVENGATKKDGTTDFSTYCRLRDSDKAYNIYQGCTRRWMNQSDQERKTSGLHILWPDTESTEYQDALEIAKEDGSPNNISAVIKYKLEDGATVLWMGDLETAFMESIKDQVDWPQVDILFAPHHGRDSGKVPKEILDKLNPKLIVIGEAPSEHLDYYAGFNTITQNSAGDIVFDCIEGKVRIYVSSSTYSVDFLDDESLASSSWGTYLGTLCV